MLDSTVSDTAFRLYAILARYGNTSGGRMPGRALLARRLHRSVDTVDRALKELTAAGILSIERRSHDGRNLTNRYHLRTHDPDTTADTAPGSPADGGGRSPAAQPRRSYRDTSSTHHTHAHAAGCHLPRGGPNGGGGSRHRHRPNQPHG